MNPLIKKTIGYAALAAAGYLVGVRADELMGTIRDTGMTIEHTRLGLGMLVFGAINTVSGVGIENIADDIKDEPGNSSKGDAANRRGIARAQFYSLSGFFLGCLTSPEAMKIMHYLEDLIK